MAETIDKGYLIGECKWSNRPVGERVLDKLMANVRQLQKRFQQDVHFVLFSLNGFTDTLLERAQSEQGRVTLVTATEMVEEQSSPQRGTQDMGTGTGA